MNTRVDTLHGSDTQGSLRHESGSERFMRFMRTVAFWNERARQRRALSELSDELLKDIGVSRTDAIREARKSFWQD